MGRAEKRGVEGAARGCTTGEIKEVGREGKEWRRGRNGEGEEEGKGEGEGMEKGRWKGKEEAWRREGKNGKRSENER